MYYIYIKSAKLTFYGRKKLYAFMFVYFTMTTFEENDDEGIRKKQCYKSHIYLYNTKKLELSDYKAVSKLYLI